MENKIILDGFWNTGKTAIAQAFKQKYGYTVIAEPDHRGASEPISDINAWYVRQHEKRHSLLCVASGECGAVMERSILSSMAFLYASAKSLEITQEVFNQFRDWYARDDSLVVVLYVDTDKLKDVIPGIDNEIIRRLLERGEFAAKYDYFYRVVVPFQYNITPLFINIFENGARKTTDAIVANIENAIEKNRIAQVNAVCFRMVNNTPQFLVMQRNEKRGGFWQTITGGVHVRDLLDKNVLRETQEEIGILAQDDNLVPTWYGFNYIGGEGYELNEYVYGYKLNQKDEIRLSSEHVKFEFLGYKDAVERVKYDGNKAAIREVYKIVMAA